MYDFKLDDKVYLSIQNLKTQQLMKKLDWKFTKQFTIKQKMSFCVYKFELLFKIKVHLTFHISLLWFSKNDSINK